MLGNGVRKEFLGEREKGILIIFCWGGSLLLIKFVGLFTRSTGILKTASDFRVCVFISRSSLHSIVDISCYAYSFTQSSMASIFFMPSIKLVSRQLLHNHQGTIPHTKRKIPCTNFSRMIVTSVFLWFISDNVIIKYFPTKKDIFYYSSTCLILNCHSLNAHHIIFFLWIFRWRWISNSNSEKISLH